MSKQTEKLVVSGQGLTITIEGDSEQFGGEDLQLRAALQLLGFDFGFLENEDFDIREKYYLTILSYLGSIIKYDMPYKVNESDLVFLKNHLEWMIEQKFEDIPQFKEFIEKYLPQDEEDDDFLF